MGGIMKQYIEGRDGDLKKNFTIYNAGQNLSKIVLRFILITLLEVAV